jgi:cobalamin biosynthesis protein CobC
MQHGGDLTDAMRRYGGACDTWLDLSTGINPWPWPVPDRLSSVAWERLPSRADEAHLIAAARLAYRVPESVAIVPAPGAQALIQWLPRLAAPGPVAVVGPTYGEHAAAWADAGHEVIAVEQLDDLPARACHAVVVNPNNPDGRVRDRATIARVLQHMLRQGGWLVVDESFVDLEPALSAADLAPHGALVVLRSFGKFYGLAGVRLGFAITAANIAGRVTAALGPWAVSGPAVAIGSAALADTRWAEDTRRTLTAQAQRLDTLLEAAGLAVIGGTTLFRLTRHSEAGSLHQALAQRHIWVRAFDDRPDLLRFGLPPGEPSLQRLATALAQAMGN